tara:strand:+ start:86 stop:454 length:369 start_codon:yes stop_codon:yes gene_type:complete
MKKTLLTAVLALFSVVVFAQEKPQNAEKHACTETCDHGKEEIKSEMKACCNAAKVEGKECGHCASKKASTAMISAKKACCSEEKSEGKSCENEGKSTETATVVTKNACCSEKKRGCDDSGKE